MDHESTTLFCRPLMGPDEYVLWQGRPEKKGKLVTWNEISTFVLCVIWTVLACSMCSHAIQGGTDPLGNTTVFTYFPLLFPLVGFALLIKQIYKYFLVRNHTEYAITNKRLYRRMGKNTDSYPASQTLGYETEYYRNGNATIHFPLTRDRSKRRVRVNGREVPQYVTLINIADVDRVQQVLSLMETHE